MHAVHRRRWIRIDRRAWMFIAGGVLLVVLAFCLGGTEKLRDAYEVASVELFPNGERAFAYGERHFNASNPGAYNLDLAEYFFVQAQKLDPNIPYLYHELARIDFLRSNFVKALIEINLQIENQGDKTPNSYYVRALIEGYMGNYADSARDYAHFLQFDPYNWAGLNDYAWVLLKAGRSKDAEEVTAKGLERSPNNPWLLNSNAIALYEMGDIAHAKIQAQKAVAAGKTLTNAEWLHSYPGNDPAVAAAGIASFQSAAEANLRTISAATSSTSMHLMR